jgi:hypothetical protein
MTIYVYIYMCVYLFIPSTRTQNTHTHSHTHTPTPTHTHPPLHTHRREVTAIQPDPDHTGYTITARYWEPQSYADAVTGYASIHAHKGLSLTTLLLGLSGTAILGSLVLQNLPQVMSLLKGALGQFPGYAEALDALSQSRYFVYYVHMAAMVVVYGVIFLINLLMGGGSGGGGGGGAKSAQEIPSVGSGGRDVTVDEMKVGGSGSASVMQGVTMDVESIRTKYIGERREH